MAFLLPGTLWLFSYFYLEKYLLKKYTKYDLYNKSMLI